MISALCVALATVACVAAVMASRAAMAASDPPDRVVREGVGSCAGSSCHSRQVGNGPHVRQDELIRWQDPSKPSGVHSRAWRVLTEARGRAIARKAGIASPESAKECVGCHTDQADGPQGQQYSKEDGVGCEACHGAASRWMESHRRLLVSTGPGVARRIHEENLRNGMKQLEDPKVRANVCLDCHFGGSKPGQFVTHEIMAAGHPRVSFELDLFSSLQQHWDVDDDYKERKGYSRGVRTWAVGQALAVNRALTLYASPSRSKGAFPELYFFDCHSCHREISDDPAARPKWEENPGRARGVRQPPFNDENMIMLSAAARVLPGGVAARFDADSKAFHAALARDKAESTRAAARLASSASALANSLSTHAFSNADTVRILETVLSSETAGRYTDYTGSAQALMAAETLLNDLAANGADRGAVERVRSQLKGAYGQVQNPNTYRPDAFRTSMTRVAQSARSLK